MGPEIEKNPERRSVGRTQTNMRKDRFGPRGTVDQEAP
jgi:hypothetical protein